MNRCPAGTRTGLLREGPGAAVPHAAMTPARTTPRHRRTTDSRRLVDAVTRVGSLVTISAVLVLGGSTGALTAGAPSDVPTVRATNAR